MNLKPNYDNDYPESWIYGGIDKITGCRIFYVSIRENKNSNKTNWNPEDWLYVE